MLKNKKGEIKSEFEKQPIMRIQRRNGKKTFLPQGKTESTELIPRPRRKRKSRAFTPQTLTFSRSIEKQLQPLQRKFYKPLRGYVNHGDLEERCQCSTDFLRPFC